MFDRRCWSLNSWIMMFLKSTFIYSALTLLHMHIDAFLISLSTIKFVSLHFLSNWDAFSDDVCIQCVYCSALRICAFDLLACDVAHSLSILAYILYLGLIVPINLIAAILNLKSWKLTTNNFNHFHSLLLSFTLCREHILLGFCFMHVKYLSR